MTQGNKRKVLVEESVQTRKAREKLKKKFESVEKKMTARALEQKSIEIHKWISKNAAQRVVLYSKNISLFDENQNTAKLSRKVSGIAEQLQKEMHPIKVLLKVGGETSLEENAVLK